MVCIALNYQRYCVYVPLSLPPFSLVVQDMVDLSTGEDIHKLVDLLQTVRATLIN